MDSNAELSSQANLPELVTAKMDSVFEADRSLPEGERAFNGAVIDLALSIMKMNQPERDRFKDILKDRAEGMGITGLFGDISISEAAERG